MNDPKSVKGVYEKVPGSKVWWIRYHDANSRLRREKAGKKSDAITLYQKRKGEALSGKKLPELLRAKKVSFATLADAALEYSKQHKRSYSHDVTRMGILKETFGNHVAESITPQEIDRWLSSQEWKPATQNRYRALISLTYKLAMQNGKIDSNPARLVRQRKENNGRIRFLSPEEETKLREKILAKFPHHLPELDLALNTGMRLSEQYGLTWDCVDFEKKTITIPRSKHGEVRRVYLNDDAIAALRTAQKSSNGQPYVFLNCYGQQLMRPREWFDQAVFDSKLKNFTWHCLRHTFASRMIMAGVGLSDLQHAMGHKTIQMTCRYVHLAPQHQLDAVQRLCDTNKIAGTQDEPTGTRTVTSNEVQHASNSTVVH